MREPPQTDPPKQDSARRREGPPSEAPSRACIDHVRRRTERAAAIRMEEAQAHDGWQRESAIGAIAVLALGSLTQAVLGFRDSLAAQCRRRVRCSARSAARSCTIDPLRDTAALSIEASDLQADPAHRGLLLLSATIRNRAAHPIAYPYLELKLTDSADQASWSGRSRRPNTRAAPPICATASRQRRTHRQDIHRCERDSAGRIPAVSVLSLSPSKRVGEPPCAVAPSRRGGYSHRPISVRFAHRTRGPNHDAR